MPYNDIKMYKIYLRKIHSKMTEICSEKNRTDARTGKRIWVMSCFWKIISGYPFDGPVWREYPSIPVSF